MTYQTIKIFTDGGARGNPGPSAAGVVIMTTKDEILKAFRRYLQEGTNNQAEYSAILFGLEEAKKFQPQEIRFYMDSELACRQLNGHYKVKNPELKLIFEQIKKLAQNYQNVTYTHIPRAQNKLADTEVNKAIDKALGLK